MKNLMGDEMSRGEHATLAIVAAIVAFVVLAFLTGCASTYR